MNFIKRHKKAFILLSVVTLITILFVRGRNKSTSVESFTVARKDITKYVSASGETAVDANNSVYAQVTATIDHIKPLDGEKTNKGDAVITLNASSIKASADKAWADYLLSKANVDTNYTDIIAAKASERATRVIRDQAMVEYNGSKSRDNKETLRTAEANYQTALTNLNEFEKKDEGLRQTVNSSYSTYLSARQNLNNTYITAPSAGVIALENLNEGSQVLAGQKLFSVVSPNTFIFSAEVDETDIKEIVVGKEVRIQLDSYKDEELLGRVSKVASKTKTTDSGATAVEVTITFERRDILPILGLNGEANIKVASLSNVLVVPSDYLEEDKDGAFVWVFENGVAKRRGIKLGLETNDYQEVLEGLMEGERVIKGEGIKENTKVHFGK